MLYVFFLLLLLRKFRLKLKRRSVDWTMACENTSHRSCDFTKFNLHHLGLYMLRVRANMNGRHSDWVQREFGPDKDGERERDEDERREGKRSDRILTGKMFYTQAEGNA